MPVTSEKNVARLEIGQLIETATVLAAKVKTELPTHEGLQRAADFIVQAARNAGDVAQKMKRPFSLHRLPVMFLAVALVGLLGWTWHTFFRVTTLSLALPDRDAAELKDRLQADPRLSVKLVEVKGSREASTLVAQGQVDLAFVQGGIPIPPLLRRAELPGHELALVFVRPPATGLLDAKVVLTSTEGEGSHSVLLQVLEAWGQRVPPKLLHQWSALTAELDAPVPDEVDAVFVVKDPSDEKTQRGVSRLAKAGFSLVDLPLGARSLRLPDLERTQVEAGWLAEKPMVPAVATPAWAVKTWLVARDGLTPRLLAQAQRLLSPKGRSLVDEAVAPSTEATSEVLQGVDAFFSILINIGLAFLALLGLDAMAYRRQFHELNSLVSLLGQLQSNKDVLAVKDEAVRRENMHYLSLVSDLLGLVSNVSSYYTQENSALVFNNLSDVIHERCNALKINIQLKLLQSAIRD
ncbi:MAG: hypothetical protein MUC96_19335 [Myxococcaceae bacterium]|jgi:hypothetical protein|nr:hypothetical protein [Myxococcaceae bacterium]